MIDWSDRPLYFRSRAINNSHRRSIITHKSMPSPTSSPAMAKQSADVSSSRKKSWKVASPPRNHRLHCQTHFSAPSSEHRIIMSALFSKELRKQYKVVPNTPLFLVYGCWLFRCVQPPCARTTKFSLPVVNTKAARAASPLSTAESSPCRRNCQVIKLKLNSVREAILKRKAKSDKG